MRFGIRAEMILLKTKVFCGDPGREAAIEG
jgi:hypothetical protein